MRTCPTLISADPPDCAVLWIGSNYLDGFSEGHTFTQHSSQLHSTKTIRDLFLTLPIHHHVHLAAHRQHRVTDLCQVQTDGDGQTDSAAGQIGRLKVFPGIQIRIQIPDFQAAV